MVARKGGNLAYISVGQRSALQKVLLPARLAPSQ
jgi:hypothetical protein